MSKVKRVVEKASSGRVLNEKELDVILREYTFYKEQEKEAKKKLEILKTTIEEQFELIKAKKLYSESYLATMSTASREFVSDIAKVKKLDSSLIKTVTYPLIKVKPKPTIQAFRLRQKIKQGT